MREVRIARLCLSTLILVATLSGEYTAEIQRGSPGALAMSALNLRLAPGAFTAE